MSSEGESKQISFRKAFLSWIHRCVGSPRVHSSSCKPPPFLLPPRAERHLPDQSLTVSSTPTTADVKSVPRAAVLVVVVCSVAEPVRLPLVVDLMHSGNGSESQKLHSGLTPSARQPEPPTKQFGFHWYGIAGSLSNSHSPSSRPVGFTMFDFDTLLVLTLALMHAGNGGESQKPHSGLIPSA
eukprot:CAMPEP_0115455092 /NCGR_PEP_ID=MMETSP0271-20121206/43980_1 /TAXON_ID=71861 /ORGANISM="Scrippsiella trochoidea, Strain CCMP3099" /LENGTH=182 /DNA_ID=CAMNT_0002881537 /DNA_START=1013 /DNA_END=1561 /DNA_ORIENTATION=+